MSRRSAGGFTEPYTGNYSRTISYAPQSMAALGNRCSTTGLVVVVFIVLPKENHATAPISSSSLNLLLLKWKVGLNITDLDRVNV